MPGNTMINAISLEKDSILFARDPDLYRFRIIALPDNFLSSPHSKNSKTITVTAGQTGDLIRAYHQPGGTESHVNLLCKLYSPNDTAFDATDIRGVQLNANGTLLAVWTKANSVYLYKRGSGDQLQKSWADVGSVFDSKPLNGSPHHLEKPLEWILRMVITPVEGQIGTIAPIGAAMFWSNQNSNYLSIGMRSSIVNTYLIDETEEQKVVNFRSFMRDKWDLWLVMSTVVTIFVVNEYKTYPVA
ncbi:hypothetical protein BD408DRAFT_450488 [Parasitella parasitica]|nr:hypothetical protein BD408DRAFT_450488 [Parasitella parasitica]